jgi:glutaredoxin
MATLELYGAAHCPYTQELRDWLEWTRREFTEYDVEADADANARLQSLTGGALNVPVLVEDGKVAQVGWQGRSCVFGPSMDAGRQDLRSASS